MAYLPPLDPTPLPSKGFFPELPPPPPQVRWGLGDVFYGILIWLGASLVSSLVLVATGELDVDVASGSMGQLGLAALAFTMATGWIGLVGWPVLVSYMKGLHSIARDFGFAITWGDVGWGVLGGFAALAISVAGSVTWSLLTDAAQPSNGDYLPTTDADVGTGIVLFLLIAVCTPIAEELFFRGFFLRALAKKWNTALAVVISSIVFGSFHFTGESLGEGLFICAVTASYGAVLALLVVFRNFRIGPSVVAHMVINGMGITAALLS